jgi:hypothetical protein
MFWNPARFWRPTGGEKGQIGKSIYKLLNLIKIYFSRNMSRDVGYVSECSKTKFRGYFEP